MFITVQECMDHYFKGAPKAHSEEFLQYLRDNYIEDPPEDYNTDGFSIYTPVWRKLVDWYHVQENLKDVFQNQVMRTSLHKNAFYVLLETLSTLENVVCIHLDYNLIYYIRK